MSDDRHERIWEMMERIGVCMLVTRDKGGIRARPMAPHLDAQDNAIRFLTNRQHHKIEEIGEEGTVCLAFSDAGQHYVSVTGQALLSTDRETIEALWSADENAWFEGKDDPDIVVLTVTPDHAEYWDRPSSPGAVIRMKAAAITGGAPDMGANRKVSM